MSETTTVLLPGDSIDSTLLPTSQKRKLGPGIRQPQLQKTNGTLTNAGSNTDYTSTIAGSLNVDHRKKSATISTPRARYIPRQGDSVIAQVRGASFETFHLFINAYSPQATLSHFAFEGASKKTRPQLKNGDLVYAKVVFAQKNMDVELTCVNPSTGKADGLGPLGGESVVGTVFDVSLEFAERMLRKEDGVKMMLDELGGKIPGGFEIVVGRNGRVWVECADAGVNGVVAVGRVLGMVDEGGLEQKEIKKSVTRTVKESGLG